MGWEKVFVISDEGLVSIMYKEFLQADEKYSN